MDGFLESSKKDLDWLESSLSAAARHCYLLRWASYLR